jgi:hypothetical protein
MALHREWPMSEASKYKDKYREIDHYAIHFDTKGEIFHFLPYGVKSGPDEYNREVVNEWEVMDLNNGKPFFTLMNIEEIKQFCKKWDKNISYQLSGTSSDFFVELLTYWLL